ncbi:nicotinamide-nucleotide adenylyltransferase [Janthinobacterium sp. BJB446]|uniref:AAA family ATPase n=1 Tax=Janthinobacterium sp. BJB446 TaxID=2048009 RepID=UPI000C10A8CE|nr:ATP-binding protein [Janthinobacterium sp. BJB446]PHV23643.1 nicotinamide-nucleotide adenylyltransferase [Janthinobacterium sp. BJB446]
MERCVRVAILGAESSGKSTLAAALAERYGTVWVPEYLREFVEKQGRVPIAADQFGIARTQVEREAAATARARHFLFCDTTPLMTVVYSRHYFNGADAPLAALADATQYDLTLVTAPDSPWVADGLQRESEAVRQLIHRRLLDELAERQISYLLVSGSLAVRLAQADDWLSASTPGRVG